jgi:hypothetical protein
MGGLIKDLLGPLIQAFSSGSCFQWRATGGHAICQVVIDSRLKIGSEFFHGLPLEGNAIRDSYEPFGVKSLFLISSARCFSGQDPRVCRIRSHLDNFSNSRLNNSFKTS